VFLISLKAGGVGLNLTAADYVYIVDPWWNPAVEQQAIDRTHRIGQTKNIFAYRMICKDTIEDKILQLQEKKRALAKELIADDATFVKSLSREDVEYLFS
jgi:non-specific serine/threonine protein kinase